MRLLYHITYAFASVFASIRYVAGRFRSKEGRAVKKIIVSVLLLLACSGVRALPVDEATARRVAENVLGTTQLVNRTGQIDTNFLSYVYLFTVENGGGFALISGDDCAQPLLAYSLTSYFDTTYLVSNEADMMMYNWIFYHFRSQISAMRSGNIAATPEVAAQWTQLLAGPPVGTATPIGPLLTTRWNQTDAYQQLTPVAASGAHCNAGSAALAVAQVMKYWNKPTRGTGSRSYTNGVEPKVSLQANFGVNYAWANMPDSLDANSTDAQREAVNRLIFNVGVSLQMQYRLANSYVATVQSTIPTSLKTYFHFGPTTTYTQMTSDNAPNVKTLLMTELQQARPAMYTMANNYAFVIDGCDDMGLFHINWGRGGNNDGYYAVGSINPGGYNFFNNNHNVVYGIEPLPEYTITVVSNDAALGTARGGGLYWKGDVVTLTATRKYAARFRRWSDGSTENPHRYTANSDRTDTAIFEYVGTARITSVPNNDRWGYVLGGGVHEVEDNVELTAVPALGAVFTRWNDGGTDNPRRYRVVQDRTDTAIFTFIGKYTVEATSSDLTQGTVSGSGTFTHGDEAMLRATPTPFHAFSHWSDGGTDNPRRLIVVSDYSITAVFVPLEIESNQVYLDDRENHSWSYYSDTACPVRNLNPADVKITYYGYGTHTMYSSDATTPEGEPDVSVAASEVGIGIDAPEKNTYVYHKTLERINGEQATSIEAADGPCFYRIIPNPYSLRPTYGTGDTRWRGFYKWRLKNLVAGNIYGDIAMSRPVAVGDMVDADDTVYFMPTAEYGMEVEFEAIWARAYVYSNLVAFDTAVAGTYVPGKNAYERNFVVYTGDTIAIWTRRTSGYLGKGVTLTSVFPNGTDGTSATILTDLPPNVGIDGRKYTFYRRGAFPQNLPQREIIGTPQTPNLMNGDGNSLKFEYIRFTFAYVNRYHDYIVVDKDSIVSGQPNNEYLAMTNNPTFAIDYYRADTLVPVAYRGDTVYYKYTAGARTLSIAIGSGLFVAGRMCIPLQGEEWCIDGADGIIPHGSIVSNLERGLFGVIAGSNIDVHCRLESGAFHTVMSLGGGNFEGFPKVDYVIGNDYDRSRNDNSRLKIRYFKGGVNVNCSNEANLLEDMYRYVVKSGTINTRPVGNAYGGPEAFYLGSSENGSLMYQGTRSLVVEGGLINGISGGCDSRVVSASLYGTSVRIRIRGGHIRGSVYGAAEHAEAKGDRRIVFTGGLVNGWVAGGANGTLVEKNGILFGNTYLYIGGNTRIQHDTVNDPRIAFSRGGNVFGAGSGNERASTPGRVTSSFVVVADSAYISRNVYGGGNYGFVNDSPGSHVYVLGGKVQGKVFGGSNMQGGAPATIVMRGGHVIGGIYGGSNLYGRITMVTMDITGGEVGTANCHDSIGNVFGCGYGDRTSVRGPVLISIGSTQAKTPHMDAPLIHGNVYCGGYLAPHTKGSYDFRITTYNGSIKKSIFGGGYGQTAVIKGDTEVNILGTTHVGGNVYGGGNMGKVLGNTRVVIGE